MIMTNMFCFFLWDFFSLEKTPFRGGVLGRPGKLDIPFLGISPPPFLLSSVALEGRSVLILQDVHLSGIRAVDNPVSVSYNI